MKEQLLTIQEAAQFLGVATKTLRRWDASGRLKPERTVGNQRRYTLSELEAFKATKPAEPQSPKTEAKELPVAAVVPAINSAQEEKILTQPQMPAAPIGNDVLENSAAVAEKSPIGLVSSFGMEKSGEVNQPRVEEKVQPFGMANPTQEVPSVFQQTPEAPVKTSTNNIRNLSSFFSQPRFAMAVAGMVSVVLIFFFMLFGLGQTQALGGKIFSFLPHNNKASDENTNRSVLAAGDVQSAFELKINVPSIFGKQATFLDSVAVKKSLTVDGVSVLSGGIRTENANIDAGTGTLTASNVIYSLLAGSNITITGDPQNPTIAADVVSGVTSFQGQDGAVALASGSGIGLDGLTITNTGVLSVQGQSGVVAFTGGTGVAVSGTTISNTDGGSAQNIFKSIITPSTTIAANSNNDSLTFAAGSGITITGDAGSKTVTITSNASGTLSGLTTNGVLYATDPNNAGSTAAGATGTVLKGVTAGAPVFAAVDLATDVTGVLSLARGGTGLGTTPTNGQLLIGNGSGYTLGTISAGAGIGISNGSGTISVTNNGVLSLTGTANQITTSGSTGAITLSLPQDIATTSTPIFASMTLTANTNQLTLGTGNTGVITLATLTGGRTYTLPDQSGEICLDTGNCPGGGGGTIGGSGTAGYLPRFTNATTLANSLLYDTGTKVGIGTTSPEGLFSVSGGVAGQALVSLNETGDQNILVGSASGTTRFYFDQSGNLSLNGGGLQFNGVNVLSGSSLGSGITGSSLTSVSTLNAGAIGTGFGAIDVGTDAISGGDITSTGTTGITIAGNGAGITFSGTGNHIINASSGTLQIGAATLTGALNANSQNVTGINNLSAGGTITFGALSTGIVKSNGSGVLSSGAVDLATGDVTGTLGSGNGGTGLASYTTGDLLYASGANTLAARAIGTPGQILTVSGGVPVWMDAGGSINYWQRANGALAPINVTDDFIIGGSATASAKFQISGLTGDATSSGSLTFNTASSIQTTAGQTLTIGGATTGNIVLTPNNGTGLVLVNGNISLATGNAYQINGANVLTSTALGSGVTSSSLTSVGALASGSIANGFGSIATANTITGTTLNGTTGINTGAAGGTLRIDNNGNLSNIGTINASGAITLSSLGTGVVQSNGSGLLSSSALNLAGGASYISGTLPVGNGGTGTTSVGSAGSVAYSNGSSYAFTGVGNNGEVLVSNGSGAPTWASAASIGTNYWQRTLGALSSLDINDDILVGGTATSSARFQIFGTTGNATTSGTLTFNTAGNVQTTNNQTMTIGGNTTGNIVLAPLNGSGLVQINGGANLSSGNAYQINGANVLTATALGSGVTGSSLTSVGSLASGSIVNGFGSIFTANTIQGSDITASGTTGFTASGNGADLAFTGGGTNIISSTGTLQINAFTLGGAITGNNQSVTGLNNLSADGTVTFGALGTGLVQSDTNGVLSSAALNLAGGASYISGILPSANGGTGADLSGATQGSIAYFSATGVMSALAPTTAGYVLTTNGAGQNPSWTDAASLGVNYWQRNLGALASKIETDDLLVGGTATASAKFQISGTTGNATTSGILTFSTASSIQTTANQTLTIGGNSTGNIVLSPLNGSGVVSVNGGLNLSSGNAYQINGANVLTSTALGSSVVGSSLTSVGALASGSIANGFGSIFTANTIQGSNITASGATGFTASGNDADLTFSGTGDHLISASAGVLQLGAYTLTGAITGNNQNLTGLNNLSAAGTITLSSFTTNNGLLYTNGSGVLSQAAAGTDGQIMLANGSGVPTFVTLSSDATITNTGALTIANNAVALGTDTTGNYVNNVTGGNGIGISGSAGEGWAPAVALTALTGDWDQTGAFDIVLNNASSELRILESTGATYFGTIDIGDLTDNRTYTFPDATGTVCLSTGNCAGGSGGSKWQLNGNVIAPLTPANQVVLGGNTATDFQFEVNGARTGKALVSFNETGDQNIITASASGATRFNVTNNGNLQFAGNTSYLNTLTSVATQNRSYTLPDSNGTICLVEAGNCAGSGDGLTGSGTAGQISFFNGSDSVTSEASGFAWDATNNRLGIGTDAPLGKVQVDGASVGKSLMILNETGDQNILVGSASGTTRFTFDRTGNLNLIGGVYQSGGVAGITQGTASCVTTTGGIVTGFGTCQLGSEQWEVANGAIYSGNPSLDFLLGSNATASAKFAVTNISGGTPTASLSAGLTGGASLAADGTLQTSTMQTLTIGSNSTGNIVLNSGNGVVRLADFTTNGGLLFTDASGNIGQTTTGSSGQVLVSNAGGAPTWADASTLGTNYWQRISGTLSPLNITDDLLVGGTSTASAKFQVFGDTGNATTSGTLTFNTASSIQTTANQTLTIGGASTGNIVLSPLNGSGLVTVNGGLSLASGNAFQINGASVLSSTTLGSSVLSSSLTSVGALSSGSIASGFGSILTTNTIQGSDITASGATGFTASGNDADLTFSGTGNHLISASAGTLQLGAVTLTGAVSGNSQNVTGIANLGATGTVTFGGLSTGVVQSNGSGVLSSAALNLAGGVNYISGILPSANGGTGADLSAAAQGAVPYFSATGVMSALAPSTAGYVLTTNGAGADPSWTDAASLGTNYWQRNLGALSSTNITDDLLIGSNATSSALFSISGTTGNASTSGTLTFNTAGNVQTTNNQTLTFGGASTGNIVFSPLNGAGTVTSTGTLTLASGKTYQINGADVLMATALGSGVTGSSLTSVGALASGSIASGFGTITTANTITGTTLNGTTGINTGAGAGTQRIDNNGNLLNIGTITASGAIRFSSLGIGVVQSDADGDLSSAALDLAGGTNYVTGVLPAANGGTGDDTSGTTGVPYISSGNWSYEAQLSSTRGGTGANLSGANQGAIPYFSSTGVMSALAPSTAGYVLTTGGAGANPSWTDAASLGTNYFQRSLGAVSPLNITDDLLVGGNATSSAKFQIFGTTGNATTSGTLTFSTASSIQTTSNQTLTLGGDSTGNITLSPLNGNGTVTSTGDLNLASGKGYQINGANVLTSTALGSSVIGSSLTSVGALTGGSIASGFGTIATANTITGTTINGTTGINTGAAGGTQRIDTNGNLVAIGTIDSTFLDAASNNVNLAASTALQFNGTTVINSSRQLENIAGLSTSLTPTAANTYALGTGTGNQFSTIYGQTLYQDGNQVCDTSGNCSGLSVTYWNQNNGAISAKNSTVDLLVGGTSTESAKFAVLNVNNGTPTASVSAGTAGAAYLTAAGTLQSTANQTLTIGGATTGNITLSPLNGSGTVTSTGTLNLLTGKTYQINGVDVLTSAALGSGITGSSLTQVGALSSGSIASGFGTIATANTITGTTINGTTGINTGAGAGTLRIDNNGNLSNIGTINASGAITLSNLGAGIVKSTAGGLLSSAALNLASGTEVTGTLAAGNGGTGFNTYTTGDLLVGNGSSTLSKLAVGAEGSILSISGGTPAWIAGSSINYWQRANGALAPLNITDDLLLGATATSGARFAFTGVAGGTPTASLSAGTSGASYLTAAGTLQTTANQTLSLGGSTTGNILLNSDGNNRVGIGTATPTQALDVNGNLALSGAARRIIGDFSSGSVADRTLFQTATTNGDTSVGIIPNGTGTAGYLSIFNSSTPDTSSFISARVNNTRAVLTSGSNGGASNLPLAFEVGFDNEVGRFDTNGRFGIGTTTTLATLDVRGNIGTLPVASFSGTTALAAMIVDNNGVGDLFTASKSGATKFVINNSGNVGIGTTTPASRLQIVQSVDSISGGIQLTSTGNNTGGFYRETGTDGALILRNQGIDTIAARNGAVGIGVTAPLATLDVRGNSGTTPIASFSGTSARAGLIVDNNGVGDLFTASKSGATKFVIDNAGNVRISNLANCNTIDTDANGVLSCGTDAGDAMTNYWQLNNGAISPFTNTVDLLVGGTSTASAKFAVLNVNNGTPTASVSAGTSGAAYLTAAGNLQTTANQSLSLGGSTTGDILLNSDGNNRVGIGTAAPAGRFHIEDAATTSDPSFYLNRTGTSGLLMHIQNNGSNVFRLFDDGSLDIDNAFSAGGSGLFNGPVSITTDSYGTNPAKLHLDEGTGQAVNLKFTAGSTTGTTASDGLDIGVTSTGIGQINQRENLALYFGTNNTTRMEITNSGSVIIGAGAGGGVGEVVTIDNAGNLTAGEYVGAPYLEAFDGLYVDTNLLFIDNTVQNGNVGVGTSNPLAKLDVRGLSGTQPVASFSGTTSNAALIVDNNGVGDLFTASKSGATKFVINNAGNVGIGTSNPGSNLEVVGAGSTTDPGAVATFGSGGSTVDGNMYGIQIDKNGVESLFLGINKNSVTGSVPASSAYISTYMSNGTLSLGRGNSSGTLSTSDIFIDGTGEVGIGTTDPNALLQVGAFNRSSDSEIAIETQAASSSILSFRSAGTSVSEIYRPAGSTDLRIWGQAYGTDIASFNTSTGRVGIGTDNQLATLDVRGNIGTLPVASFSGTTARAGLIVDNNGVGDLFTASKSGATKFVINNAGNVGIGTSTPSTTLDVAGTFQVQNGATPLFYANPTTGKIGINTNSVMTNVDFQVMATSAQAIMALIRNDTTTSADEQLGSLSFGSTDASVFAGASISAFAEEAFTGSVNGTNLRFYTTANGASTTSERLRISADGNFGFNTTGPLASYDFRGVSGTTPVASISGQTSRAALIVDNNGVGDLFTASKSGATKFTVTNSGDVRIANLSTAGGVLYTNGTGTIAQTAQGVAGQCLQSTGTNGAPEWGSCDGASSVNAFMTTNGLIHNGNLTTDFAFGGNSSASAKFQISISGTRPTASISATTANAGLVVDNTIGDLFAASSSGLNRFVIKQDGNVGIGTTDPSYKLDVAGTIRATDSLRADAGMTVTSLDGLGQLLNVSNFSMLGDTEYITDGEFRTDPNTNWDPKGSATLSSSGAGYNGTGVTISTTTAANDGIRQTFGSPLGASEYTLSFYAQMEESSGTLTTLRAGYNDGSDTACTLNSQTVVTTGMQFYTCTFTAASDVNSIFIDQGAAGTARTIYIDSVTLGEGASPVYAQNDNGYFSFEGNFTNPLSLRSYYNSTTAFQVKTNADFNLFVADTTNRRIGVGTGLNPLLATMDVRGTSGTTPVASFSGTTAMAGLIVDNNGVGDLFVASKSGATKFAVLNNGDVRIANLTTAGGVLYTNGTGTIAQTAQGVAGQCLQSQGVGGAPTWGACDGAASVNAFTTTNGLVHNGNLTTDFAFGGATSESAKFKISISGTRPTASISATTANAGLVVDNTIGDLFAASSSGLNRFVIKQNGSVGIGTMTPDNLFTVRSSANDFLALIQNDNNSSFASGLKIDLTNTGANNSILELFSNSVSRFLVQGDGSVGIGTTSPVTTLDIRGNSGTTTIASISGQTARVGLLVDNNGVGDLFTASKSGATKFVVNNAGNVGIGTATPTTLLDITGTHVSNVGVAQFKGASTLGYISMDTTTAGGTAFAGAIFKNAGTKVGQIDADNVNLYLYNNLYNAGTPLITVTNLGNVGIGTGVVAANARAKLDVQGSSGTQPVASFSGQTAGAALIVDNNGVGDVFTASKSGKTFFTVKNNGVIQMGNSTDGISFDYLAQSGTNTGIQYFGRARPTKQIVLSPEYAGGIITASGSATTDGDFTADASASASTPLITYGGFAQNYLTYYEWSSAETSLQDYTVGVRVTLPADFSSWAPGGSSIQVIYNTELTTTDTSKLDFYLYPSSSSTPTVYRQAQSSSTARTWRTLDIPATDLTDGTAFSTASQSAMIYMKMSSKDNNHIQISDIILNYLSKF